MARPSKYGTAARKRITIRLTEAQKHDLDQVARENKTDIAGVIRDAVNVYVADYRDGDPAFCLPKLIH